MDLNGAPTRTRTADLLITNQLLYQLSYRGTARVATQARGGVQVFFGAFRVDLPYRFARANNATAARPTSVIIRAAGAASAMFSRLAFSCTRVASVL